MKDLPVARQMTDPEPRYDKSRVLESRPYDYKGQNLSPELRDGLRAILFDEKSYLEGSNTCLVHPDAGFRILTSRQKVVVIYCFHCRQMETTVDGTYVKMLSETLSQEAGDRLLDLTHRALPRERWKIP
jgi:hypothetical protein